MGELLIKDKDIVVPGETLAVGMDYLPSNCTFREDDKICASQIGIVIVDGRVIRVVPLKGKYSPKQGDVIIGRILDMTFNNWYIDIGTAANAVLSVREATEFVERGADLSHYYSFGDLIVASIAKVTRSAIELSMRGPGMRKLGPGKLMKVDSTKIPRIIGKQGSMISMIKDKTGCRIIAGQNGLVWIQGEPERELITSEIVLMITQEAHHEGLTDKVSKLLEEKLSYVKDEGKKQTTE